MLGPINENSHKKITPELLTSGVLVVNNFFNEEIHSMLTSSIVELDGFKKQRSLYESKFVQQNLETMPDCLKEVYNYLLTEDGGLKCSIAELMQLNNLVSDPRLYAGGVSLMERGDYLSCHIDNSHNADCELYRRVNLLYYLSPVEWKDGDGGEFYIYDKETDKNRIVVPPRSNTLVVMLTTASSFHGVNKVNSNYKRYCISVYYYSKQRQGEVYYHPTTYYFKNRRMLNLYSACESSIRKLKWYLKGKN